MHPDHPVPSEPPPAGRDPQSPRRLSARATSLGLLLVAAVLMMSLLAACWRRGSEESPGPSEGGGGAPADTGQASAAKAQPPQLFRDWPGQPAVALVLTGQQHSYLKFCGCSRPQLGGFERRYNFLVELRARGWPVVAVDLGDLVHFQGGVQDQSLLKYETAMKALQILNYTAIALGEHDYNLPLLEGMARFTLQQPNASPRLLAANLAKKDLNYPHPIQAGQSMIQNWQLATGANVPRVGVVALTGRSVENRVQNKEMNTFENNRQVLKVVLEQMKASNVELRVLLFQGVFPDAKLCAQEFPDLDVILCLSDEDTPPARPDVVGRTMIVRVGHKGKHVGVVGAYRSGKPERPFDLHYQKVEMGEEHETAKDKEKDHPILKLLQEYAETVRKEDFLTRSPKQAMPAGNLRFVGSQTCQGCHQGDYNLWSKSKHSHALDALVKVANKPTLRQYDPECVVCHTVGYSYAGGYVDDKKTPHLKHVGCENCHGPGSAHVAQPKNPAFYAALSPWKTKAGEYLPTPDKLAKGIEGLTDPEKQLLLRVDGMCQKCHDVENDPHFKFEQFWPKVLHGKNAK